MAFSAEPKGLEEILLHCGTGDLTGSDGFALKGLKLSISLLSKLPRKLQNQKKIHSTQPGFRSRCSSEEPSLLAAPPIQAPLGAGLWPCSQHNALSSQLFPCRNCPSPGLLVALSVVGPVSPAAGSTPAQLPPLPGLEEALCLPSLCPA